jgi:hypothetical protein
MKFGYARLSVVSNKSAAWKDTAGVVKEFDAHPELSAEMAGLEYAGSNGWELVVANQENTTTVFYFKRAEG